MTDVRHKRLERYETWAAECEALARRMTDPSKQKRYKYLAAHYQHLAGSFREALATYGSALAKLTLH